MRGLTNQQRAALAILRTRRAGFDCDELARLLDRPREGAAATAASLVRRGHATRTKRAGRVHYQAVGR